MLEIIAAVTDKFQLEIIKPSLDFVLASAITPSDYYEYAKQNIDKLNKQTSNNEMRLVNLHSVAMKNSCHEIELRKACETASVIEQAPQLTIESAKGTSLIERLALESEILTKLKFDRENFR